MRIALKWVITLTAVTAFLFVVLVSIVGVKPYPPFAELCGYPMPIEGDLMEYSTGDTIIFLRAWRTGTGRKRSFYMMTINPKSSKEDIIDCRLIKPKGGT